MDTSTYVAYNLGDCQKAPVLGCKPLESYMGEGQRGSLWHVKWATWSPHIVFAYISATTKPFLRILVAQTASLHDILQPLLNNKNEAPVKGSLKLLRGSSRKHFSWRPLELGGPGLQAP